MKHDMFPSAGSELSNIRRDLAPETLKAFHAFSRQVFAEGALDVRTKQLIAVAVARYALRRR